MGMILVNGTAKFVPANPGDTYIYDSGTYVVMADNAGFATPLASQAAVANPQSAPPVTTADVVSSSAPGFDPDFYKAQNPDVAASGVDPLTHFRTLGWKEGRDPNPYFDTKGYLATYGDVKASGINPLDHYNNNGWKEGRDPSAWFDTSSYLDANPDVKAAGVNPLQHFLQNGQFEGRVAIPQVFDDTNGTPNQVLNTAPNGTAVGVTTSWGHWATTRYSIGSDTSNGGFAVDPTTGVVTVADSSKISTPGNYAVTVVALDDGHSISKEFNISVGSGAPALQPPVITSDGGGATASKSVAENSTAVTTVTSTDADGPTPSYSIVGGADQGKFTINASTGQLSFLTAPNFEAPTDSDTNNTYIVTVRASDGALTDDQTITVTVTDVNAAPIITSGTTGTIAENASAATVVYDANATDDGENSNTLTFSFGGGADDGMFSINSSTGEVRFLASPNFEAPADAGDNNVYNIIVRASDGTATTDRAVAITVTNVNETPVASDASFSGTEDIAYNGAVPAATDGDGNALTYAVVGGSAVGGSVTVNPNGTFTFTPTANFNGNATFQYVANDGTVNSAPKTVTINFGAVNDAPVADADGPYAVGEDGSLSVNAANGVLAGDVDVDTVGLTATLLSGPAHATSFSLNTDGSFNYTPAANFSGADTFVYRAFDGAAFSDPVVVTINVTAANDAPVAANASFSGTEDIVYNGAVPAATDAEGSPLTYAVVAGSAVGGSVLVNPNGTFTFTPTANFNGNATFQYVANDGTVDSVAKTVTINFGAVNDAPVADADGPYAIGEDGTLTVNAANGVLAGDVDVELSGLTATLLSGPAHATSFSLNTDGSFSYTPAANFNGADSFVYRAFDGTDFSAPVVVTINVTGANDAPVAASASFTGAEDVAYNGAVPAATDADGNPLTYAVVLGSATNGSVTVNPNGTFTFTPTGNFNGNATFQYVANDGTVDSAPQTITINFGAVNDAPVADADGPYSIGEDGTLTVNAANGVLTGDTDVDLNGLTASLVSGPAHAASFTLNSDGSFSYAPAANYNGADTFTYRAFDGTAFSDPVTVTINVTAVNDAPVASTASFSASEDVPYSATLPAATDVDGNPLTYAVVLGSATNGSVTVNPGGTFTFTPTGNFNGNATFQYVANDGTVDSAPQTVTINFGAVNDAPVAVADTFTIDEDATPTPIFNVLGNDTDVEDAGGIPVAVARINGTAIAIGGTVGVIGGAVTLNNDQTLSFTPTPDFAGDLAFTYTAKDGAGAESAPTLVTVHVNAVNDAPVAVNNGSVAVPLAVTEDTPFTINLLANDSDVESGKPTIVAQIDGQNIIVGGSVTVAGGSVKLNADQTITFTPTANLNATGLSFTYVARDVPGGAFSNTATVFYNINAVNDAPVANADIGTAPTSLPGFSTNEDTPVILNVLANDTDIESGTPSMIGRINGTPVSVGSVVAVTGGSVTVNGDWTLTFTPTLNSTQDGSFTYTAKDSSGAESAQATVVVDVIAQNDAPVVDLNGATAGVDRADLPTYASGAAAINVATAIAAVTDTENAVSKITLTLSADVGTPDGSPAEGLTLPAGVATALGLIGFTVTGEGTNSIEIISNTAGGISPAVFENILKTVLYHDNDTTFGFNAEDRTVTVTATDGSGLTSAPALVHIDLAANVTDVNGGSAVNNFVGANLADTIRGNDGNDTMEGRGGNDTIWGGTESADSGLDTAKFTGDRADYTVTRTAPGVYTVADSVSGRDGTDTVHDVETAHFNGNNFDLALDAAIQVFDSTGSVLLASYQANQLDQAVNFANGHAGADIIELRSSASPFTAGTWPATVTEAVTIKAVGGTATINAGANSGIAIAASAVLGGTDTVRLDGLNVTGTGATDTVGVLFSGVYEGPSDGAIQIVNTSVSGFGQNGVAIIGGGPGLSVTIDGDNAATGPTETALITGSGGSTTSGGSGDILFFAFTGAAALKNIVVTGTTGVLAGSADNGIQFAGYDGGDHSVDHAIGAVTFQNVAVNGTYEKNLVYIQGYDNLSALGFSGGLNLGGAGSAATWTALFIDGGPQGIDYALSGTVGGAIDGNINLTGVTVAGGTYGTSPGFAVLGGKQIVVNGTLTDDLITGTLANEAFIGLAGDDTINAGGGNDLVLYNVGAGHDTVDGQGDIDTLGLINFNGTVPSGTSANFAISQSGGHLIVQTDGLPAAEVDAAGMESVQVTLGNGGDTVTLTGNIAGAGIAAGPGGIIVTGGTSGDTLDASGLGSASAITFSNLGGGNDTFKAANVVANDVVDGGAGTGDSLDYSTASAAVTIDLQAGTASGTSVGTDSVSNFENATGAAGNDNISGTTGANTLSGGAGDDTLTGRGGNDTITGGSDTGTVAAHDVAVFGDVIANYTFDFTTTPGSVIVHNTVTLADATVTGVEELQFSGGVSVALVNVAGSSLDTIQEGVDVSTTGGRVYVGAGTYNENVSIAKGIGVVGLGNSVNVHGNFKTDNPAVDLSHGGSVADFLETATSYSGASGSAFTITASNVAIDNINIDSFRDGVLLAADLSNITLTNLDITDTILGIANDWGYSNIERSLSNLTITGGSISDGHIGIDFEKGGAPAGIKHVTGVAITGTTFSELTAKGIYFEDLSNATITGVGMNHVGYWGGEPTFGGNASGTAGFGGAGIELNLKKGAFSNIAITNFNLINTGTSDHDGTASGANVQDNGAAISVKIRSANANYSPVSYTGTLDISNGTINGTSTGIRAGENNQIVDGPAVNITNVSILGAAHDAKNGDIENLTTSLMAVTGKATGETWWISQQSTGQIKIDDIGGADTATYNGTTAAETFNVNLVSISGTDYVAINKEAGSPTPVLATAGNYELATHDVEDLVINTGNGGDTVVVSGTLNGTGLSTSTITVNGGTGADTVDASGLSSDHRIVFNGGDGNDTFKSSARDNAVTDEFHGGNNTDTVDYSAVTSGGVTVDLSNAVAQDTVSAGTDLITGVENVTGTNQADTLTGNSADNVITGNGGNDVLRGGGGNDTIAGGSETDTALYADGPAGYSVTISGGTTTVTDINAGNGDEGTDTLTGVETLDFNGTIVDLTANVLVYTGDYSGTGPGALKASYGSIAAALAGASTNPGDTIIVKAGSYSENITISEGVILRGLGSVMLNGSVVIDGGGAGQNALIDNIDVNGTGNYAVQVAETSTYTSVAFKNGNVTGGNYGGLLLGDGNETGSTTGVGTLVIESANFSGNVVTGSGGGGDGPILIYRYNGNVTLKNVDITGGVNIENGIQIRGAAALAASGALSFENVDVHGTFARTGVAIRDFLSTTLAFNGSAGNSALDVDVTGGTAYTGLHIDNVGGTVDLSGANAVDVTHYVPTTGAITMTGTGGVENFTADSSNDVLVGLGGNDTLDGAGGNDIYVEIAGDGADTVNDTGSIADSDTLAVFGVGTTVSAAPVNNGTVSDTVSATVVAGKLATLDGGTVTGIEVTAINLGGNGAAGDTLDYTGTTESLTVNLGTNSASGFNAGAFNIENVTGGSVNDSLTGSASANVLSGSGGDDTLKGNGGDDTLLGGAGGVDTAAYDDASGNYTITYNVSTGDATVAETAVNKGAIDEGTDTLDRVELLDFGSGDIDLNAQVLVFSSFDANTGTGTLKSSHSSIQSAVNAADGNDTVYIRNGSYTEQVNVGAGKDGLTILGQSEAGVVIHAPTSGLTFFATDPNANPINRQLFSVVTVSGSDTVTIKNLTVDGDSQAGQVAGSGDFNGIAYVNSSGTVEDVTVREIRDTLAGPTQVSGNQRGNAVLATYTSGSPKQFNLIDSTITDYQKTGVVMRNATVNLDDNTVTGFGIQNSQAQNGIQLSSGSTGLVNNNHISALGLSSLAASPAGILLFNAGVVAVTGNDYTGTAVEDIAIALVNTSGATISGNIIATATQGIAESGTMTVENNVVNTGAGANSYAGITSWNHEIESSSNIAFTPDGSNGPDRYVTGGGNDVLTGNGGDDFLQARGGVDQMLGGAGNDTIVWTAGDGNDTLIDGGAHTTGDTLQVFDTAGADTVQVVTSGSTLVGIGGGTTNVQNIETVTLNATAGGTDTLDYTGTTTAVSANLATNVMTGFSTVTGSIENVTGGSAGDTLVGSSGANVINGGAGDDQITGAGGNDTLSGGADSDTFNYTVGDGQDTVDGGSTGVTDVDTLNIAGTAGQETYNINPISGGHLGINIETGNADVDATDVNYEISTIEVEEIVITTNGGGDSVIVAGDLGGTGVASSTVRVTGDSGNNTFDASGMTGTPVRVVFDGAGGTDTLKGGAAGDLLIGGDGDDTITGNGGNDTIYGGSDTSDTGTGDKAVFSGNSTDAFITFTTGQSAGGDGIDVSISSADGNDTTHGIELLQFANGTIDLNANVLVFSTYDANTGTGTLKSSHSGIQSAVTAADADDVIYVRNGTYIEQVTIGAGKSGLTILGQSEAGVIVQAPNAPVANGVSPSNGRSINGVITVDGVNDVSIKNLTVDGALKGGAVVGTNPTLVGIAYLSSDDGLIDRVTVTHVREADSGFGNQRNLGIYVSNADPAAPSTPGVGDLPGLNSIEIKNTTVTDFQKGGIVVAFTDANIHDNTVTGRGVTGLTAQNGIQVSGGTGALNNNTVTGVGYDNPAVSIGYAILTFNNRDLVIDTNHVTGTGIATSSGGIAAIGSTGVVVTNNDVHAVLDAIDVYATATFVDPLAPSAPSNPGGAFDFSSNAVDADVPFSVFFRPFAASTDTFNVTGTNRDDEMYGATANDTLNGGVGSDILGGRGGADTISGGAGDDIVLIGPSSEFAAGETIDGGANTDTIRFTSTTASDTLTLTAGVTNVENVVIGDADGVTTGTTALNVNASAVGSSLNITGNDGANTIVGTAFADVITANSGNDAITGGNGGDTIHGGAGLDTAVYTTAYAGHSVAWNGTTATVTGSTDTGAADIIDGVGKLQFSDKAVWLVNDEIGSEYTTLAQLFDGSAANGEAAAGDLIILDDGTYTGDVTIDRAVTILGANAGIAGAAGGRGAESVIDGRLIVTAGVTIDGVKVLNNSNNATQFIGVRIQNTAADVTVRNSVFYSNGPNGSAEDRGVNMDTSVSGHVTIADNLFTGTELTSFGNSNWHRGIWSDGSTSQLDITGNTFDHVRSGINLDGLNNATTNVSGNTFLADGTGVAIGGNYVGNPAALTLTAVHDNFFNATAEDLSVQNLTTAVNFDATATNNTATEAGTPVFLVDGGRGADVLVGTAGNDVLLAHALDNHAGNDVNTLTGKGGNDLLAGAIGTGLDTALYAGAITLANLSEVATDANPFVTGIQKGWQVNGGATEGTDTLTDIEIIDGAGAGKILLVGNGGYASIAAAYSDAVDGDTILIASGTYTENVVINKAITIAGVNHGVASNGARPTESEIIGQLDIKHAGVTVDGIKITNGAMFGGVPAGIYVEADNVTITNSVFVGDGTSQWAGVTTGFNNTVLNLQLTDSSFANWYFGTYFNPSTDIHASGNIFNDTGLIGDDFADTSSITGNTFNGTGAGIGYGVLDTTDDLGAVAPTNTYNTGAGNGIYLYGDGDAGGQTVSGTAYDDYFTDQYKFVANSGDDDHVEGKAGHDYFQMTAGADEMVGGAGDDVLLGGTGNDTAIYAGTITTANITAVADADPDTAGSQAGWQVDATAGGEGTDGLVDVEFVDGLGTGKILLVGNGAFASIQDAVNAANDGDTILIAAGTWSGPGNAGVTVDKAVTFVGKGTVTIDATGSSYGFDINLASDKATGTVAFKNLTIANAASSGISSQDQETLGTLSLDGVTIRDSAFSGLMVSGRHASAAYDQSGVQSVVIANSTFTDNAKSNSNSADIMLFEFDGNASLTNVAVSNNVAGPNNAAFGIQIAGFDGTLYDQTGFPGVGSYDVLTAMGTVSFNTVSISGSYRKPGLYIQGYTDTTGLSFTNSSVNVDSTVWDKPVVIDPMGDQLPSGTPGTAANAGSFFDDAAANGSYNLSGLTVTQTGAQFNELDGTTKADTITGTNANDQITGFEGADTLNGGGGNDVFIVAAGAEHALGEVIDGGLGTNVIRFTSTTATDTLTLRAGVTNVGEIEISDSAGVNIGTVALNIDGTAAGGSYTLTGNDGANNLKGGSGANTINAGDGADTIDAGGGVDTVNAGGGNDTVIGTADGVADTYRGDTGTDTIDYSALVVGEDVSIDLGTGGAAGAAIGGDTLVSFENATAGGGNDSVFGSLFNNVLHGGGGTDNIVGDGGSDQLFGDGGSDTLNGGVNDFVATPAAANDVLWGGTGTDTFRFEGRFGSDAIGAVGVGNADWTDNEDMVFVGYSAFAPIIVDVTDGVLITVNDGAVSSSVFVAGATASQMQTQISGLDLIIH